MRKGKERCGPFLAEQILGDSRPYTPHAEGTLEDSARVEKIGDDYAVTYNTVYAAYQWYGCWPDGSHVIQNHNTDVNSLATTQWIEAAKKQYGRDWHTVAQREFVRGADS
jgi:hypothetical protein